jgi:hypothetical protein
MYDFNSILFMCCYLLIDSPTMHGINNIKFVQSVFPGNLFSTWIIVKYCLLQNLIKSSEFIWKVFCIEAHTDVIPQAYSACRGK